MKANMLILHTPMTPGVGSKGHFFFLLKVVMLNSVCYDLLDTEGGGSGLDKLDLCFVIYMFLSNNPSPGDKKSSNLSCCILVSSVDNLCKQLGPRPGPTKCRA